MNGSGPGQIERMRGGGAHRNARSHDADRREGTDVRVHASTGRDDVVGSGGHHAREWNVVDVIGWKLLPVDQLRRVVQLDPPRTSRGGISGARARSNLIERQLCASNDPARLS